MPILTSHIYKAVISPDPLTVNIHVSVSVQAVMLPYSIMGTHTVHAHRVTWSEVVRQDKEPLFLCESETISKQHVPQKQKHNNVHRHGDRDRLTDAGWDRCENLESLSRRKKHCSNRSRKRSFWKGGEWGRGFTHPDSPPGVGEVRWGEWVGVGGWAQRGLSSTTRILKQ